MLIINKMIHTNTQKTRRKLSELQTKHNKETYSQWQTHMK